MAPCVSRPQSPVLSLSKNVWPVLSLPACRLTFLTTFWGTNFVLQFYLTCLSQSPTLHSLYAFKFSQFKSYCSAAASSLIRHGWLDSNLQTPIWLLTSDMVWPWLDHMIKWSICHLLFIRVSFLAPFSFVASAFSGLWMLLQQHRSSIIII